MCLVWGVLEPHFGWWVSPAIRGVACMALGSVVALILLATARLVWVADIVEVPAVTSQSFI